MFHRLLFFDHYTAGMTEPAVNATGSAFLVPGLLFVCLGLLILFVPQLLVAMVASLFIGLGVLCLIVGWKVRGVKGQHWGLRHHM